MKKMSEEIPFEDSITLTVQDSDRIRYKRFDHYLANQLSHFSRSFIKKLYDQDLISWHEDSPIKQCKLELKKMPPSGSMIHIEVPPPAPIDAKPENIPLEVLFEDDYLVFINKPAGLVTHPAPGNYQGTLVNAILYLCPDIVGIGNEKRPGIVHRLDKGTSGVMVIAKTQKCHEGLISLFSTHTIERRYEALVFGTKIVPKQGTLTSTIGRHHTHRQKMAINVPNGRRAITHYKVIKFYKSFSHLELKLETGRTHQIRVHLNSLLNCPVLNDPLYGNPDQHLKKLDVRYAKLLDNYPYPLLHAKILSLVHPITGQKLFFEVAPPEIFQQTIQLAEKELIDGPDPL